MVLTNAERQARYQRRLRERVANCVDADEIVAVAKLIHERESDGDVTADSWEDLLAACRQKKNRGSWPNCLPADTDPDGWRQLGYSDEEADRIVRVAAVVRAVLYPPKA
jgi:hypothetical protein